MTETPNDTAEMSDPVRRGLVGFGEAVGERQRLRPEVEDPGVGVGREEARSSGLENELRRAEIHRDEARVERDAAVREAAKHETLFEAQWALMREFSPKPAPLHLAEAAE